MALTAAGAFLMAGGAFSATSSILGAQQQAKAIQKQAEYNAQVYDQQATMVKEKQRITNEQYARESARARSKIIASASGKGFNLGGSPLAILADNESQMLYDQAISDYNANVEYNHAKSGASYYRAQGSLNSRATRYAGYGSAFSTILNTGAQIGMLNLYKAGKL